MAGASWAPRFFTILRKFGWSDVALVERSVLTAGSSWHAAGGFHALNANPNMAILQAYTIDLLKEVEAESGQSIGMHMTGGIHVASAPERWEWLQSSYRRFQAIGIDDVRLVTPEEIKARCPIINVDGRARGHVGRPRGLCRHHRHGLGLCRRGQEARRDGDRAQPGG